MTFHIVTAYPQFFFSPLCTGLFGKALLKGVFSVMLYPLPLSRQLDDEPYGGGSGMVIKIEPVVEVLRSIRPQGEKHIKIYLSPSGKLFTQKTARYLSEFSDITLVCSRFEGIDSRIEHFVDEVISIGDFVIHSGETASLVIIESIVRLLPDFMSTSTTEEIEVGLLGFPQFTRPREFEGLKVPDVLLSGHHAKIRSWRIRQSVKRTLERRPDLLAKTLVQVADKVKDEDDARFLFECAKEIRSFLDRNPDVISIPKVKVKVFDDDKEERLINLLTSIFEKIDKKPDPFLNI